MMSPDPEKLNEIVIRLQDAFQSAADKSTGPAKPLFEKLSDNFNRTVKDIMQRGMDGLEMNSMMAGMAPTFIELQTTMLQLHFMSRSDSNTAAILKGLENIVKEEMQNLMEGLAGFSQQPPNLPPQTPPRRKKPGSGNFDL